MTEKFSLMARKLNDGSVTNISGSSMQPAVLWASEGILTGTEIADFYTILGNYLTAVGTI
ncbi:MAG: hypothetical protein JJU00_20105 [Opitutales bacterium]|nr:hypothetical protein [Opitutales bacterium]